MSTITFDTQEAVIRLKTMGVSQEQADAIIRVISDAQESLVTREYLDLKFQQELLPIKVDLAVLKWMMGLLLGGMLSLIIKAFV